MSEKNPVAVLDIRLVDEKLIGDAFFQDYKKVHERVDQLLEHAGKPYDDTVIAGIEGQLLAWLRPQEAAASVEGRLDSLFRCGLAHVCVAIVSWVDSGLGLDDIVSRSLGEMRARGWADRHYDPGLAEAAAVRYPATEKKSAPGKPASILHVTAAGKSGSRQWKKEVSTMNDGTQDSGSAMAGTVPVAPADKPVEAKVAKRGPRKAAAKKAPAKKAAAAKPKAEKKVAAKKAPAKKAAAKPKPEKKLAAKKVAAPKKAVAKKAAPKKLAAKKAAPKKAVAKKAAPKKAVAKKVAAKKPLAEKKLAAKKPAAKKLVAKKPAAKKVVAKKAAAPKKAAAKKTAAKKPAAKKAVAKKAAAPKKAAAKRVPAKK
ncbi:MAG: histone H1-like repetitive region-containing protein [Spirochaetota bacterium]